MIPIGTYAGVAVPIEGAEDGIHIARWGLSGKEGDAGRKKQVMIYCQVIEPGEWQGTVLPWTGYFGAASYERTLAALRLLGFVGDDLSKLDSQRLDNRVLLAIGHNTYEGKTFPRVDFINDPNRIVAMKMKTPMSAEDISGFAAYMKNHCKDPKFAEIRGDKVDREKLALKPKHAGSGGAGASKPGDNNGGDDWQPPRDATVAPAGAGTQNDDDIPF